MGTRILLFFFSLSFLACQMDMESPEISLGFAESMDDLDEQLEVTVVEDTAVHLMTLGETQRWGDQSSFLICHFPFIKKGETPQARARVLRVASEDLRAHLIHRAPAQETTWGTDYVFSPHTRSLPREGDPCEPRALSSYGVRSSPSR